MTGKINDACPKYMTLINIGYLSSQIQQFKLRGNFKNDRFPLTSMLTSLKKVPKMSYTKFYSLSLKFA